MKSKVTTDEQPPYYLAVGCRTAAKMIGICERTLWQLTKDGKIPHVKIGNRTLYRPSDLDEWLMTQLVPKPNLDV